MIVGRLTFNIKPGRMDEALALFKAEVERYPGPGATRVYGPSTSPFDVLAIENEFESYAQLEAFFAERSADPGTADFYKQWGELRAGGGTSEVWTLA